MIRTPRSYNAERIRHLSATTIAYYDRFARAFWDGTRHHDVSQNYAGIPPCDRGRVHPIRFLISVADPAAISVTFDPWGTKPSGSMDRSNSSAWRGRIQAARCSVPGFAGFAIAREPLRRDFCQRLTIPCAEPGVAEGSAGTVQDVEAARCPVLIKSHEGTTKKGWSDGRYACFLDLDTWRDYVTAAGFVELDHHYRAPGLRHGSPGSGRFGVRHSERLRRAAIASAAGHRAYLRGDATIFRRRSGCRGRRPNLPRRPQRLGQVDLAAHGRRTGASRCR